MAEKVGHIATSVIEELTRRLVAKVMKKFDKQAAVYEKLQRLEMLLIKIHSTIEVSQKYHIQSTWLLQWQEKLKEGSSQGDEVLASFKQRAEEESARSGSQQVGSTSGTLSFSRIMLSGTTRYLRNVTKVLFSNNDDVDKLNSTMERLEDLAADIGRFIRLVEQEVWAEREKRSTKRQRRAEYCVPCCSHLPSKEHSPKQWKKSSTFDAYWEALYGKVHRDTTLDVNDEDGTTNHKGEILSAPIKNKESMIKERQGESFQASEEVSETTEMVGSPEIGIQLSAHCMNKVEMENEMLEERLAAVPVKIREAIEKTISSKKYLSAHSMNQNENMNKEMLEKRLGTALHKISKAIELADSQNIIDLLSLPQWIGILREAMQEGNTVLRGIKNNTDKEMADFGQEADELFWYLHSIERLADDVIYVGKLIVLVTEISNLHINLAH